MIESIVQCLNKVHIAHILICIQDLAYIPIPSAQNSTTYSAAFQQAMFDAFSGADSKDEEYIRENSKNSIFESFVCNYFYSQCCCQRYIICGDMHFQVFLLQNDNLLIRRYFSFKTRNTGRPKYEIFNTRLYRNRFDPGLIMVYEGNSLIVSYANSDSISSSSIESIMNLHVC